MARVLLVCLALASARGEMRETMERMVMVRTSGSDLQPAATGYIYKSDGQGPVNIIKLEESDVIKHLEAMPSMYQQPEAFAAPIPVAAGPFYTKREEGVGAAYTIPIVEVSGDEGGASEETSSFAQLTDGNGGYHEDFDKVYAGHLGASSGGFDEGGGHGGGYHHGESGAGGDYGSQHHSSHGGRGSEGYGSRHGYAGGDAGHYGKEHHDGFSSHGGGDKSTHYDEAVAYGEEYSSGKSYKSKDHGNKHGHSKGEKTTGFHNLYDKDEFKKDHDFYDVADQNGNFHKHGSEGSHYGTSAGDFKKGGSHDSGYHHGGFGKHGFSDKGHVDGHHGGYSGSQGGDSTHHHHAGFGSLGGQSGGKQFGFEYKH